MKLRNTTNCDECCKGKRISELDEKVDIQGTEYIPYQEGDDNGKFSLGSLKDYLIKLIEEYLINNGIIREDWVQSEPAYKLLATLPELIADRACKDEFGNNINDTYLTREAVKEYIGTIYEDLFVNNPPQILDGFITVDMLSDAVLQLLNSGGAITNFPDDEDITVKDGKLKFKDKVYDPNNYSGMGRTILRKNMVDGVNVLTQEMMSEPNVIYVIQYDYDLRGETIVVPDNSILWYLGGSLNNGHITSDDEDRLIIWGNLNGDIEIDIDVSLVGAPADEEDITTESGVLKFKDKEYDTASFSGLGRKYLRKNIVSSINKNILTQDMIKKTNTRYIIQYDYDLNSTEITIPEGCILDFQGGSLRNGSIVFNSTEVNNKFEFNKAFISCTFKGIVISSCDVVTFGADNEGSVDNTELLNNLATVLNTFYFKKGKYLITDTFTLENQNSIYIGANTSIHKSGGNTNPAIHLYSEGCSIRGESRVTSTITTDDDSPYGILSIGFKNEIDTIVRNILNCSVSNIGIIGKNNGGNDSGNICYCIYMCNPFTSVYAASYFHKLDGLLLEKANVGIGLIGDANANQISNIFLEQIGNNEYLGGAGILLKDITWNNNKRYPVENAITNVFHHVSSGATTIFIDAPSIYNSFLNIISEQGGSNARWIRANNENVKFNVIEGISNTLLGWNVWSDFFIYNTVINTSSLRNREVRTGILNATTANISSLDAKTANISSLNATTANISSLDATTANISSLDAKTANISSLDAKGGNINNVGNLDTVNLDYKKNNMNNTYHSSTYTLTSLEENKVYKVLGINIPNGNPTRSWIIDLVIVSSNPQALTSIILSYTKATYVIQRTSSNKFSATCYGNIAALQVNPIIDGNNIYFLHKTGSNGTSTNQTLNISYSIWSANSNDDYTIETYTSPEEVSSDVTYMMGGKPQTIVALSSSERIRDQYTSGCEVGRHIFDYSYKKPVWWNGEKWVDYDGYSSDGNRSGATALRPTGVNTGFVYFDSSLGKPIWWTGSKWVDATGAGV